MTCDVNFGDGMKTYDCAALCIPQESLPQMSSKSSVTTEGSGCRCTETCPGLDALQSGKSFAVSTTIDSQDAPKRQRSASKKAVVLCTPDLPRLTVPGYTQRHRKCIPSSTSADEVECEEQQPYHIIANVHESLDHEGRTFGVRNTDCARALQNWRETRRLACNTFSTENMNSSQMERRTGILPGRRARGMEKDIKGVGADSGSGWRQALSLYVSHRCSEEQRTNRIRDRGLGLSSDAGSRIDAVLSSSTGIDNSDQQILRRSKNVTISAVRDGNIPSHTTNNSSTLWPDSKQRLTLQGSNSSCKLKIR
ncbi:hypothetical protein BDQ17DRAFT_1334748 [Cyathus striatus]|nr:hypothetical protein BDQ17DRAFT_1334748 [Cyathus striatus]